MASELQRALLEVDAATEQHLTTHRRDLHAEPELAFKEVETAAYLRERLDALAPDRLETGVAGTGIVADFKGQRSGRGVLVRADMDGLPIQEAGDLGFKSTRRGVMHACGHDVHMAIALEASLGPWGRIAIGSPAPFGSPSSLPRSAPGARSR